MAGAYYGGNLIRQAVAFQKGVAPEVCLDEGGCEGISRTDGVGDFDFRAFYGKPKPIPASRSL